jgi:hypothetical protein
MKKVLFMMLAIVATLITSCSKDAKINRRIDGEWQVKSIAGVAMGSDESYVFKFNKDNKLTGDGTATYTDSFGTDSAPFTYSVADQKITIVADGVASIFSVSKYVKDKLELIDEDNDVWVLDPK